MIGPGGPPADWSVDEVGEWLVLLGLGVHQPLFAEQAIDGRLLLLLTVDELKSDLGVGSNLQVPFTVFHCNSTAFLRSFLDLSLPFRCLLSPGEEDRIEDLPAPGPGRRRPRHLPRGTGWGS